MLQEVRPNYENPKKNLKRILMIATGGTIASKRSEEGLKPLMTSEELLGFVPDVKGVL
ncbi:MAG: asparaginase domain-containing protein [Clostridium sp.]